MLGKMCLGGCRHGDQNQIEDLNCNCSRGRGRRLVVNPLFAADFRLEIFTDPQPVDSYQDVNPERYEEAMKAPEVVVVRAHGD
jgi:hypothetical protein